MRTVCTEHPQIVKLLPKQHPSSKNGAQYTREKARKGGHACHVEKAENATWRWLGVVEEGEGGGGGMLARRAPSPQHTMAVWMMVPSPKL